MLFSSKTAFHLLNFSLPLYYGGHLGNSFSFFTRMYFKHTVEVDPKLVVAIIILVSLLKQQMHDAVS